MKKLVVSIVLVNLLAACASQKPPVAPEADKKSDQVVTPVVAPVVSDNVVTDELNDPKSILAGRSVFYPFDVSAVQEADKKLVQAHAAYLSKNVARNVRLEGNCDERGSTEYNIALGQRRADGVKKMLELGGAKPAQLNAVSYGEEKPRAAGHEEAAWSQNRRTDLNYGAK